MLKYVAKDTILTIDLKETKMHEDSKIQMWVVDIKFRPTCDKNGFANTNNVYQAFDTKQEAEDFIKNILKGSK